PVAPAVQAAVGLDRAVVIHADRDVRPVGVAADARRRGAVGGAELSLAPAVELAGARDAAGAELAGAELVPEHVAAARVVEVLGRAAASEAAGRVDAARVRVALVERSRALVDVDAVRRGVGAAVLVAGRATAARRAGDVARALFARRAHGPRA